MQFAKKRQTATVVMAALVAAHPKTFMPWGQDCFPLKVGIREDVVAAHPEFSKWKIHAALSRYTDTKRYLKALVTHPHRVDLDGNAAGEITQDQFNDAVARIAQRPEMKLAA